MTALRSARDDRLAKLTGSSQNPQSHCNQSSRVDYLLRSDILTVLSSLPPPISKTLDASPVDNPSSSALSKSHVIVRGPTHVSDGLLDASDDEDISNLRSALQDEQMQDMSDSQIDHLPVSVSVPPTEAQDEATASDHALKIRTPLQRHAKRSRAAMTELNPNANICNVTTRRKRRRLGVENFVPSFQSPKRSHEARSSLEDEEAASDEKTASDEEAGSEESVRTPEHARSRPPDMLDEDSLGMLDKDSYVTPLPDNDIQPAWSLSHSAESQHPILESLASPTRRSLSADIDLTTTPTMKCTRGMLPSKDREDDQSWDLSTLSGEPVRIRMTNTDLAALQDGARLNDIVLNGVLQILNHHPSEVLIPDTVDLNSTREPSPDRKRQAQAALLIILPFHHPELIHWSVFVARKTSYGMRIVHYDSLSISGMALSSARGAVNRYLQRLGLLPEFCHCQAVCAQQEDTLNCGVFVIEAVRAMLDLRPVPESLSAEEIQVARKHYRTLCHQPRKKTEAVNNNNLRETGNALRRDRASIEMKLSEVVKQDHTDYRVCLATRLGLLEIYQDISHGSYEVEHLIQYCAISSNVASMNATARLLPQTRGSERGVNAIRGGLDQAHHEVDKWILRCIALLASKAALILRFRNYSSRLQIQRSKYQALLNDLEKFDQIEAILGQMAYTSIDLERQS